MQIYRISTLFSGLVERVNEMRYANRQNAFDREAAHEAILNRINANLPNPPERDLENNRGENADPLDVINGDEQDPDPLHQAGNNEDMLLGGAGENDDMLLGGAGENEDMLLGGARERPQQRAPVNANAVRDDVLQQAQAQAIPIPLVAQGRRPYHALARENAEALNVMLTRDLPLLTQQLQQTMELTNELIRRRLEEH